MNKNDSVSTTNIYETDQSYLSLCKNPSTHGCGKLKCPCPGRWINCSYYIDITKQQIRLKLKDPKRENDINEWYEIYFKFNGEFHDLYCSG